MTPAPPALGRLFSPVTIGPLRLANRVMQLATTNNLDDCIARSYSGARTVHAVISAGRTSRTSACRRRYRIADHIADPRRSGHSLPLSVQEQVGGAGQDLGPGAVAVVGGQEVLADGQQAAGLAPGRVALTTLVHYARPPAPLLWPPLSAFHRHLIPGVLTDAGPRIPAVPMS